LSFDVERLQGVDGRRPPFGVSPESLIRKRPNKASVAMLASIALTDIVAGRTDHNACNTQLLLATASASLEIIGR